MAARARLLLFDEPTSGLDPITALTVDAEIIKLRDLHVTSLLVTLFLSGWVPPLVA